MYFKRLTGIYGSVTIPSIGLTVGTMGRWSLTRREETPPGLGEWDLHAVFSYINAFAFNSQNWAKEITVTIGDQKKGQHFRLELTGNERTVLDGQSLVIEGAGLCQVFRN